MTTYRHTSDDGHNGCGACFDEATSAVLNGDEPLPGCRHPEDDGEGYCATCGHTVEAVHRG